MVDVLWEYYQNREKEMGFVLRFINGCTTQELNQIIECININHGNVIKIKESTDE